MQLQFVSFGGIFREGLAPLWIGQSIFSAAVVTLIVRARMQGMDESLEHAANDLFATPLKAFWQITKPAPKKPVAKAAPAKKVVPVKKAVPAKKKK